MLIYINHYLYIIMIERIPQLKNRDYDATYRENGTPCPKNTGSKYSDHNVNDEAYGNRTHCDNCLLCKQQVVQANSKESCGVMCMWRDEPPFPPLYHIDEENGISIPIVIPAGKKSAKLSGVKQKDVGNIHFPGIKILSKNPISSTPVKMLMNISFYVGFPAPCVIFRNIKNNTVHCRVP